MSFPSPQRGVGFSLRFLNLLCCLNFPQPWQQESEQCLSCNFPLAGDVRLSFGSLRSCLCPCRQGFFPWACLWVWGSWGNQQSWALLRWQPAVRESTRQVTACGTMGRIIQKYKSEKQNSCVVCFLVTAGVGIAVMSRLVLNITSSRNYLCGTGGLSLGYSHTRLIFWLLLKHHL